MRRGILAALLLLLPAAGWAQNGSFIRYHPPAGTGTGSGDCDPAQFSSPGGDIVVGGIVGACTLDLDSSTVGHFTSGTGAAPATGTLGDSHFETDALLFSVYPATDTPITVVALPGASGAPTDDNVPVGTGTAWAKEAIPDCQDTAGNHLNRTASTNAWSCGTSTSGGGGFTASTFTINDDFTRGLATTGNIGETGWNFAQTASAGSIAVAVPEVGAPGIIDAGSGTTDNGGPWIFKDAVISTDLMDFDWDFYARVNMSAITSNAVFVGIKDASTTANAIQARFDTDAGDATWFFQICNAAGAAGCAAAADDTNNSVIASTLGPTADVFQWLHFYRRTAGVGGVPTIYAQVAAETPLTFCSSGCDDDLATIPADGVAMYFSLTELARAVSNARTMQVDRVYFTIAGLAR
jgi:hypothetical protein